MVGADDFAADLGAAEDRFCVAGLETLWWPRSVTIVYHQRCLALREYLNVGSRESEPPGWSRPRPCWPESRPIARAGIGRATEPRLAGSRGSRPFRVTIARPTPTTPGAITRQSWWADQRQFTSPLARNRSHLDWSCPLFGLSADPALPNRYGRCKHNLPFRSFP